MTTTIPRKICLLLVVICTSEDRRRLFEKQLVVHEWISLIRYMSSLGKATLSIEGTSATSIIESRVSKPEAHRSGASNYRVARPLGRRCDLRSQGERGLQTGAERY
jgi:hypothetical protein